MPNGWLNVPHFQQEVDYSCIAACVRMVLAHYGDIRSEAELRSLLDTQPTGTRAGNVMRVSGPTFEVYLRPSNLVELQQILADQQPPIVFLKTGTLGILEYGHLPYGCTDRPRCLDRGHQRSLFRDSTAIYYFAEL